MTKNFSLSTGIYRVDQHKKISLIVLLFMTPIIIGAIYVGWNALSQSGETGIGQSISGFFFYLYQEQFMFLILFVALVLTIPLYLVSVHSRTLAYITIDSQGFEYHLPFLARGVSNKLSPTRSTILWSDVSDIQAYQGKQSQTRGIKGVPSSRLDSAKIEIITEDFRIVLNPYKWLQEGCDDHRLTIQDAAGLTESATNTALKTSPLMETFDSFKQSQFTEGS